MSIDFDVPLFDYEKVWHDNDNPLNAAAREMKHGCVIFPCGGIDARHVTKTICTKYGIEPQRFTYDGHLVSVYLHNLTDDLVNRGKWSVEVKQAVEDYAALCSARYFKEAVKSGNAHAISHRYLSTGQPYIWVFHTLRVDRYGQHVWTIMEDGRVRGNCKDNINVSIDKVFEVARWLNDDGAGF